MDKRYNNGISEIRPNPNQLVKGKILLVGENEVYIDVGYKTEAIVPLKEFTTPPEEGQEIEIVILGENSMGNLIASKQRADRIRLARELAEKLKEGGTIEGRVLKTLYKTEKDEKGNEVEVLKGFLVDVGAGLKTFVPASHMDIKRVANPMEYIGKIFEFKVINKREGQYVLSRKEVIKEELKKKREEFFSKHQIGDIIKGKVISVDSKKAILDFDGIKGILRASDYSWRTIKDIKEFINVGDEMEVKILMLDKEKGRVLVGKKQLERDPFEEFLKNHKVDDIVKGKVIKVSKSYAIVEIEEGVNGVIFKEDLSWTKRYSSVKEAIKVGEMVEAKIIDVLTDRRLVKLGIKQLLPDPWEKIDEKYKVGMIVRGRVSGIIDKGVFVRFGDGIEAFMRKEDISWDEDVNPRRQFIRGQMVEVMILKIDKENKRMRVGMKQVTGNPWEIFAKMYPRGKVVEGTIKSVSKDKLVIDVGNNLEAVVYPRDFGVKRIEDPQEVFKVGDPIKAVVKRVIPQEKVIELSIKEYEKKLVDESKKQYVVDDTSKVAKATLADLLKKKLSNE